MPKYVRFIEDDGVEFLVQIPETDGVPPQPTPPPTQAEVEITPSEDSSTDMTVKLSTGNRVEQASALDKAADAIQQAADVVIIEAQRSFQDLVTGVVHSQSRAFGKALESAEYPPDEAEVTFSLNITADFGNKLFSVASIGAETNFEIKLTWKRPAPPEGQQNQEDQ